MGRWLMVMLAVSGCVRRQQLVSLPIRTDSFVYSEGMLSQAQVLDTVLAQKAPLRECMSAAHRNGDSGKLIMVWDVSPEGRVENVGVRTPEYAKAEVAHCVADTLRTWRFPAAQVATLIVFPFKF